MDEDKGVIEQRKDRYRVLYGKVPRTTLNLVKYMDEVRQKKEKAEAEMAEINAEYDVLRIELIPAKMEEEGIENIRVEGVGLVTLTGDMWIHVQDKMGLFNWLKKNKIGDLIQATVNGSTLKAFVKERLKKGKPLPEEFLNVEPYTRASIRKG